MKERRDYNSKSVVRNGTECGNRREGKKKQVTLANLKREKTALMRQGVGNGTKSMKRNELGRKNKTEAKRPEKGKANGKYRKCQGGRGTQKSVQHSKHPS